MANYKKISGQAVKCYDSDPPTAYPSAWEGQLYYNTSDGQFKYQTIGAGAWASGGNLNTARYRMQGGMGTYNTAYAVGGATPAKANVESYNGSAWTETTDIPTARSDIGAGGTATAGFALGGEPLNPSPGVSTLLEWDGSSWTTGGSYPREAARVAPAGTQTAAIFIGGSTYPYGDQTVETYSYNGSSFSEESDYPTIVANAGAAGTTTATIVEGGYTPAGSNGQQSHTYNGSAWTEAPDMNNTHTEHGFGQKGTTTSALSFGGEPNSANVESFNGTSWTEQGNLSTGRSAGGSTGDSNNSIYFGGSNPPPSTAATEEWTLAHTLKKVTTS